MQKITIIILCFTFFLVSCKKNSGDSNTISTENKGVVFVNITDPRLAEIETDEGQRITFFGQRELDGSPKRLTGYSITTISDPTKSDFVGLDNSGRYSNIFLRTGEKCT